MKSVFIFKKLILFTALFLLLFSLSSCKFNAYMGGGDEDNYYYEDQAEIPSFSEIIIDGNNQIIYGPDGTIIRVPVSPDGELINPNPSDDEKPEVEKVTLPNGVLVKKEDVIYLDDGTVVRKIIHEDGHIEHESFFTDGTWASSYYLNDNFDQVNYNESSVVYAQYHYADHRTFKEEYYHTDGMKLYNHVEWVYSEVEIGTPNSPIYLSSKISMYYGEDYTSKTVYEFDPVLGDQKYYKMTCYDENGNLETSYDYKYYSSGVLEKETGTDANGSIIHARVYYENGNMKLEISNFEDGSGVELYYDEQGVKTLSISRYANGGSCNTTYKNGIEYFADIDHGNGLYSQLFYDETGVLTRTDLYENGSFVSYETYERNEYPAISKVFTRDKNHVLIELVEYIDNGEYWEYSLHTSYYPDGKTKNVAEYKDGKLVRFERHDENGNVTVY